MVCGKVGHPALQQCHLPSVNLVIRIIISTLINLVIRTIINLVIRTIINLVIRNIISTLRNSSPV